MLMSKGVLYSRPQKKTCQSSYFPALGLFGDYLYIKLKMNGISTDFQKSKISSQQNKLVCFTTHRKKKSFETCEELVRLFKHFAKGNLSRRMVNKEACTIYGIYWKKLVDAELGRRYF